MAGRASIMTALTASCLLVSMARADDLTALEKKSAATGTSMPEDADPSADKGLDPTVLQSHVSLSNEFKDQEFGAAKDTATLNLAYAFGKTARPDGTVQLDLPVVHYDAGHVTGVESGTGIGDIEFRIGHVLRSEGLFRYAVGVEAEFDTAGGPALGDGIFGCRRSSRLRCSAAAPSSSRRSCNSTIPQNSTSATCDRAGSSSPSQPFSSPPDG